MKLEDPAVMCSKAFALSLNGVVTGQTSEKWGEVVGLTNVLHCVCRTTTRRLMMRRRIRRSSRSRDREVGVDVVVAVATTLAASSVAAPDVLMATRVVP